MGTPEMPELRFEDMDKLTLINLAKTLYADNIELARGNTVLTMKLQMSDTGADELRQTVARLQSQITTDHLLTEDISQLKKVIEELEKENEQLKEENSLLKAKLQTYEVRLKDAEDRLLAIEMSKVAPLSTREAMRILERWLCFEAVGKSKNKFKKFYNFDKISKDPTIQHSLDVVLADMKLDDDHLTLLSYLKDCGDYVAHTHDHVCTMAAWEALFCPTSDRSEGSALDEEEIRENDFKADLLRSLMKFLPADLSGDFRLVDPVEKPIAVPSLELPKAPQS